MRTALAASVLLLLGACGGATSFIPLDKIEKIERVDPARYADEDAVIQRREIEIRVGLHRYSERRYTRYAVLRSAGTSVAKIDIPIPRFGALAFLRARAIGPQGDVHALAGKDIFHGEEKSPTEVKSWVRAQVPSVEVGSIVEIEYEIEYSHRLLTDEDLFLDAKFPIEIEGVALYVDKRTASKLFLKNIFAPIDKKSAGDMQVASFGLKDVPAYHAEPYAPPERMVRPGFGFHLSAAAGRQQANDWASKLSRVANVLYSQAPLDADLVPPPDGKGDVRAFLARAAAFVAARTDLSNVTYDERTRSVREILLSHAATTTEKASLLRLLLSHANVDAHFAVVGRAPGELDPRSPQTARFGHLIVTVPAQDGIDARVTIDPSCESCAVGELPGWTARAPDAPVDAIEFWRDDAGIHASRLRLENSTVKPDLLSRSWDLTLDPQGGASIEIVFEERGEAAIRQATMLRALDLKTRQSISARAINYALPGAKVVAVKPASFDKRTGTISFAVRAQLPQYATISATRTILPLTLLPSQVPSSSTRPRSSPLYIAHDLAIHDRFTLHVPDGWTVDELPGAHTHAATGLQLAVTSAAADDTVTVEQSVELTAGDYSRDAYAEFARAVDDGASLRSESIVLKRK